MTSQSFTTSSVDQDPEKTFTAIMNEWTQPTDYATRWDHLVNGGGQNDPYLLNAMTVQSNGGGNAHARFLVRKRGFEQSNMSTDSESSQGEHGIAANSPGESPGGGY